MEEKYYVDKHNDHRELLSYIREDISAFRSKIEHILEAHIKDENERFSKIEHQLSLYRNIILFIKALGYTFVFIFAFKFGDIKTIWTDIFDQTHPK